MSNAEEPKAGQWWLRDDERVMLIAFDERTIGNECSCPIIAYRTPSCGKWYGVNRFVRRLPDDAGFDWKPEPEIVFPQYCIPGEGGIKTCHNKQVAFWKFDDNENGRTFHTDGTWFPFGSGNFKDDKKRAVTQEEALARITSIDVFSLMFDPKTFTSDWGPFPEQPPKPNRIPVRLYWYDGNVVARYGHTPPTDPSFVEIKLDPQRHISDSGFYVEGTGT